MLGYRFVRVLLSLFREAVALGMAPGAGGGHAQASIIKDYPDRTELYTNLANDQPSLSMLSVILQTMTKTCPIFTY